MDIYEVKKKVRELCEREGFGVLVVCRELLREEIEFVGSKCSGLDYSEGMRELMDVVIELLEEIRKYVRKKVKRFFLFVCCVCEVKKV